MIVLNERSLRRTLRQFLAYYHERRTHLSLDKDAPLPRAPQPPACGAIIQVRHVGGLHHHYERRLTNGVGVVGSNPSRVLCLTAQTRVFR